MPRVEFEPMIPVFDRAKTVHALGRAATVIGTLYHYTNNFVSGDGRQKITEIQSTSLNPFTRTPHWHAVASWLRH
jgi:hypothetical protein